MYVTLHSCEALIRAPARRVTSLVLSSWSHLERSHQPPLCCNRGTKREIKPARSWSSLGAKIRNGYSSWRYISVVFVLQETTAAELLSALANFPARMDVGSGGWVKHVDGLTHNIHERLSLEGTVLSQRAKELRGEAIKVRR
jgi:hypothetical protein